jgi:DNA-binding transcriptional regulator YiaG
LQINHKKGAGRCSHTIPAAQDTITTKGNHVPDTEPNISTAAMPERNIAERIKAARQSLGLSQSQAAKAWKLNTRTLQDWEQGARMPSGLYRERIERILRRIEKD